MGQILPSAVLPRTGKVPFILLFRHFCLALLVMRHPKVSVVIPLFNKSDTVRRTIASVCAQVFEAWELIIVDDGSTDGGAELVNEFEDERIRVFRQENAGVSIARNRGIEEANAEWIAFLDADDEWLPKFLEILMPIAEAEKDVVMLSANQHVGLGGPMLLSASLPSGLQSYFRMNNGFIGPVHSSNCLISKQTLTKVGGFVVGQKLFEDWTCWMKAACDGDFYFLNQPLSIYHADSECSASRQSREPKDFYRYAFDLVQAAEAILSKGSLSASKSSELRSYLNRFILRSACPGILPNGGLKECRQLLRAVRWEVFRLGDIVPLLLVIRRYCRVLLFPHLDDRKRKEY